MHKFEGNMIMASQQDPPQQSGLSLPLQLCIRCGATTNFNVKCLVYNCRQPTPEADPGGGIWGDRTP